MPATLSIVTSALVILVCFQRGRTLQCLSCDEVLHPRYCDVTSTCDINEVCSGKSIITRDGLKAYRLGCTTQDVCSNKTVECSECCRNDLCNAKLCGEPGYPGNRGPICYSCDSRPYSQHCNIIKFCATDEVCSLSSRQIFSETVFTTGCSEQHTCNHSTIIVGRRNVDIATQFEPSAYAQHYHRCCNQDLCNVQPYGQDCLDILQFDRGSKSGVYKIRLLQSSRIIHVLCDMETDGGGWTVFQKRFNGSVDFYRKFSQYENGFGSIDNEFWLGLRNIYELSSSATTDLRIDLEDSTGSTVYETFHNFSLKPAPKYTLYIDKGFGTAGSRPAAISYRMRWVPVYVDGFPLPGHGKKMAKAIENCRIGSKHQPLRDNAE